MAVGAFDPIAALETAQHLLEVGAAQSAFVVASLGASYLTSSQAKTEFATCTSLYHVMAEALQSNGETRRALYFYGKAIDVLEKCRRVPAPASATKRPASPAGGPSKKPSAFAAAAAGRASPLIPKAAAITPKARDAGGKLAPVLPTNNAEKQRQFEAAKTAEGFRLRASLLHCALRSKSYSQCKLTNEEVEAVLAAKDVHVMLLAGRAAFANQDILSAVHYLKRVVDWQPLCLEVYDLLYRLKKNEGSKEIQTQYQDASFASLTSAAGQVCGIYYTQLARAERDLAFANYPEAISKLSALLKQFPKNAHLLILLARAYLRNGQPHMAKKCLLVVRDTDPGCVTGMDELAMIYANEGDVVAVNQLADACLKVNENKGEAWCVLAHYYTLRGMHDKAILTMERALLLDRDRWEFWYQKARLLLEASKPSSGVLESDRLGRIHSAIDLLRRAQHLQDDPLILQTYLEGYIALQRSEQAINISNMMLELCPHHRATWHMIGRAFMLGHSTEEARQAFERCLASFPDAAEAAIGLSELCLMEGRAKEAITVMEKHLSRCHSDVYLTRLADAYIACGVQLPVKRSRIDETDEEEEEEMPLHTDGEAQSGAVEGGARRTPTEALARLSGHLQSRPASALDGELAPEGSVPTFNAHQQRVLAGNIAQSRWWQKAVHYYNRALIINPDNERAADSLAKLERVLQQSIDEEDDHLHHDPEEEDEDEDEDEEEDEDDDMDDL